MTTKRTMGRFAYPYPCSYKRQSDFGFEFIKDRVKKMESNPVPHGILPSLDRLGGNLSHV